MLFNIIVAKSLGDFQESRLRHFVISYHFFLKPIIPMTDQDALPTVTATFPLIREILIREGIEIVHAHQATSVMANESVVYASALGLPSIYTDHSLFQFDDLAGVILNRVSFLQHFSYRNNLFLFNQYTDF